MKHWIFMILGIMLLAGCGTQTNQGQEGNSQNLVNVRNSTIPEVDRKSGQDISRRLVELSSSIPNVNDATAIVLGPYAIVGIDVNKNLERSEVGSIKYSVAESLKNDPYGARAVVIADPDLNARLREVAEDIRVGKPVQGIMNELADIAGRLMPEIPADIERPTPKKSMEKSKKGLNKNEEQELEKKQEEQSNYYK